MYRKSKKTVVILSAVLIVMLTMVYYEFPYVRGENQNRANLQGVFNSNDSITNTVMTGQWTTEKEYNINLKMHSIPRDGKPYDLVLLLDMSTSMNWSMSGVRGVPASRARLTYLKNSVQKLVSTLKSTTKGVHKDSQFSVVVFSTTDGNPGNMNLFSEPSSNNYEFYKSWSGLYRMNSYRIMAEALNQAKMIKGNKGEAIIANETVMGYGPNTSPYVEYHGVNAALQVNPTTDEAATAWDNYMPNTNLYSQEPYKRDLLSYYYPNPGIIPIGEFESPRAGNYNRTGTGLGATVFSIGIFDESTYTSQPQRDSVLGFMRKVVTQPKSGEQNFFSVLDEDELAASFEILTGRVSGNYDDIYARYYYDDTKFTVANSDGGELSVDQNGDACILWKDVSIRANQDWDRNVVLKAVDSYYEEPDGNFKMELKVNNAFKEISEDYIFREVIVDP